MISAEYRALNAQMHAESPEWGTSGAVWAPMVQNLCERLDTVDVLDYGAGKGALAAALPFDVQLYDPCIPGIDHRPRPARLVISTDVLEHVEPEHIDAVLDDIVSLSKGFIFLHIATQPAIKHLPDGRNAHLLVQDPQWWLRKLMRRFRILEFKADPLIVLGDATPTA